VRSLACLSASIASRRPTASRTLAACAAAAASLRAAAAACPLTRHGGAAATFSVSSGVSRRRVARAARRA
jgi:hypothetical protein